MSAWTATGRTRHTTRRSWGREFLVLQIEERGIYTWCVGGHIDSEWGTRWRDATAADMTIHPTPHQGAWEATIASVVPAAGEVAA